MTSVMPGAVIILCSMAERCAEEYQIAPSMATG